jgi:uncharacterized membrane protein SpoIIM required for sporulation
VPPTALSSRWIEKRRPHWRRLEALVERGQRGISTFVHDELRELALLYRQTAADLATARDHRADAQLAAYLNQLLGRAHNLIYSSQPAPPRDILGFYTRTFPRAFRSTWRYTLAAIVGFSAGAVMGAAVCLADPGFERFVLGGHMMDTIERREMWTHSILAIKPLASSRIMTNNLGVSFLAFALGITAGLGTAWLMFFNGVLMGVIGVACQRAGMATDFWSFVAPHGSLELPAIFIAGGAGLLLGHGLLVPGTLPRLEALRLRGGIAVRLLLGVIPLLIVAGVIEGFVSPVPAAPLVKVVIGLSLFVLLVLYLWRGGHAAADAQSSPRSFTSR